MKALLSILCVVCVATLDVELNTEYVESSTYRVTRETSISMETTDFQMERDGEPIDRPFGGGRGGSSSSKTVVFIDRVLAAEDGEPTQMRRVFETVEGETSRFGQDVSLESPLLGLTLLLTSDGDGGVEVEVEEGEGVDDDAVLEGHRLTLALDALLPSGAVAGGAEWDVDAGALLEALGLDLDGKLFAPAEFDFGGFGGGGGGGGRGGGGRGPGRAGVEAILRQAEWSVSATLHEEMEEVDGTSCQVVELLAAGSGSLEDAGGPFGQRRGGALRSGADVRGMPGTEFDIELEGKLYFSAEAGRPVRLEIEGDVSVESENEFERNGSTMRIVRSQEGSFEQTVTVVAAE